MIIGIFGKAGAGKDSVVDAMLEFLPTFDKYSFAKPLKDYCAGFLPDLPYFGNKEEKETPYESQYLYYDGDAPNFCGLPQEVHQKVKDYFKDIVLYRDTITAREILQFVGTDIIRAYDSMFWVKYAASIPKDLVIADVRFENELAICDYSFKIVGGSSNSNEFSEHASENDLPDRLFTAVFENEYNEAKKHKIVRKLAQKIVSRIFVGV